jgi:hypothetical protein
MQNYANIYCLTIPTICSIQRISYFVNLTILEEFMLLYFYFTSFVSHISKNCTYILIYSHLLRVKD